MHKSLFVMPYCRQSKGHMEVAEQCQRGALVLKSYLRLSEGHIQFAEHRLASQGSHAAALRQLQLDRAWVGVDPWLDGRPCISPPAAT